MRVCNDIDLYILVFVFVEWDFCDIVLDFCDAHDCNIRVVLKNRVQRAANIECYNSMRQIAAKF